MLSRRDLANAIRALSMDAVQKANSGHPGAPMGMADIAEVLWNDFLRHNPVNPHWVDRDRFVMSNGHGSMLLYSLLHLTGYDLPLEEIRQFRQLHSKTPGHPEFGYTPGIETTTGPLGQGLANAVGMAIAERVLAAEFNRDDFDIVNHHTYVSVGDGCLMEGISHEVCSLAGTLKLGKLITFFDSNNVSIDGDVSGWFTEDTARRFEGYNWHVIRDVDGHDPDTVKQAIEDARAQQEKPTLIECNTVIGYGSPNKQGTSATHGAALGDDEVALVRETIGWPYPPFEIPDEYYRGWDARDRGREMESAWQGKFDRYKKAHPQLAAEFERRMAGELPDDWQATCDQFLAEANGKADNIASRKASQNTLEAYGPVLPELIGGSADLTGSNLTQWSGSEPQAADNPGGKYIYYGVREFGMSAINSGMSLHGGLIPYGGTFLMFSEYARNALRMAALMKVRNIFIYTHDSIGLGEDGPTHQAVEQAATLRLMPNMVVWRPCDTVETAVAWRAAIENRDGPTSLLFSRQTLQHIPRDDQQIAAIQRGAYPLIEGSGQPEIVIIATGSEVALAWNVVRHQNEKGRNIRLVSMPSAEVFDAQDAAWRDKVLPPVCRQRIAVEAGVSAYWTKYVGLDGKVLGIDRFGESAPGPDVYAYLGITEDALVKLIESF